MAYYFMVEKKRGEYSKIDITSSNCFFKKSRYKQAGACSLEEIDVFTAQFYDEAELRKYLSENNLLSIDLLDKPLSIRLLKDGKYGKVTYDFFYQKDIEYLIDHKRLILEINERFLNRDLEFIGKLARNFQNYYICNTTASELLYYIEKSIREDIYDRRLFLTDENRDNLVVRLLKLLMYKHYQLPNGKIVYQEDELNYANFHAILAFVNHYDEPYNKKDGKTIKQTPLPKNNQPKKKKKIPDQIEGQYSLFN